MDIWVRAGQLMLSLSILVVLHEFGHYLPAKFFKTRVEKFYLFFNPWFSLFKKKIGETTWGIGWLPLGGYVKIAGMVDESMDKEQLAKPAEPWEFRSKKAWQRLIIMIGGVTVNLIVGVLIYIFVVYGYGEDKLATKDISHGLAVHPYMEKFGLKSGDLIVGLDGENVENALDPNIEIMLRGKRELTVKHQDGSISQIKLPDAVEYELFKEGAFPAFGLRHQSTEIEHLISSDAIKGKGFEVKKSDFIYQLNGKVPSAYYETGLPDVIKTASLIRGSDTLKLNIPAKSSAKFMACFAGLNSDLRSGDVIKTIAGRNVQFFDEIVSASYDSRGKNTVVEIIRDGQPVTLQIPISKTGSIGLAAKNEKYVDAKKIKHYTYSFGESIGRGFTKGYHTLNDYMAQLKFIFTKKGAASIGGFGSMGKLFPPTWDWEIFWLNTALISIILAFMNILPIPALDGGHVVFLIYEMITGKEAPQKVLEYAQYAGIILLLGLMVYANGNDIYKSFFQ